MIKDFAILSPIFVTLFWAVVFFAHNGERDRTKNHLGVFMMFAFLLYCTHAVFFSNLFILYAYLEGLYIFTMLAVYPMYFIYILSVTTEKVTLKKKVTHLIPAFVLSAVSIVMTFILTKEQRIFFVQDTLIDKNLKGLNWNSAIGIKGHIFFISRIIFLLQVVYYAIAGIKVANRHNKRVENFYSDVQGKLLNWVRDLSIIIPIVGVASIVFAIIGRSYFTRNEVSLLIPSAIFSIILFEIGLKGNQQLQINDELFEGFDPTGEEIKVSQKEQLKNNLIRLFESDKIYKQTDLRITTVSECLKTNRTYVSRLINEEFNINFNEFVNRYRVKEARELLNSRNNYLYTMELIAEKSGFGSVNSFTRVFKELEGVTPGQFKNNG